MRARSIALTLLGTAAALSSVLAAGVPAAATPAASASTTRSCASSAQAGRMTCFALRRTDTAAAANTMSAMATPGGYGPTDLRAAYKLPSTGGAGATVAIVDAYDDPKAEADLNAYRTQYGLGACTTANGCFRKVNQNGAATPVPSADSGWAGEISLDLDMVAAICPSCKILLVEANSANGSDLYRAEDTAVALGAKFVSNSWGGGEYSGQTTDDAHFNHPGVAITASTGDSGVGAAYPATSKYVTAVGGTTLRRASNTRGWTESAWSGAGSGCSAYDAKPTWQTVSTACTRRAEADVSAVADPSTGVAVYQTYGGSGWAVYGGTSAAAPIIAATYALAGTPGATDYPASYPYAHQGNLFDVTSGSNGGCGAPGCAAKTGWDGPSGLGTPNGLAAFIAGATKTAPVGTTPVSTTPTCAPNQIVANGGLETGSAAPWTASAGVVSATSDGERPHTGNWYAWLDGYGTAHTDTLTQSVAIPAACHTATLTFWLRIDTADGTATAHDKLTVKAGTTTLVTYSNRDRGGYAQKTFNLSSSVGTTVAVSFTGVEDGSAPTSFVVDDVAVSVS